MINPIIYTFHILGFEFSLRWYGVIVMTGVIVASLIIERELRRRDEKGDLIWDVLLLILPVGIIGARLWYVLNATIGGNPYYANNPIQIINIPAGGLHIFGGFLFGAVALVLYLRKNDLDIWLFLDSAGPAMLIGQAIGRLANFINQELYGPPTTLPWGIPISAEHRLPEFASLPDTTRFHPTFAYELIWNVITASILLWISRRYEKQIKPGTIFAGWLISAGVGRTWIEIFFRPDQPKIPGLGISYSGVVSALMAIAGAILLMVRYKSIKVAFAEEWEDEYKLSTIAQPAAESEAQAVVVEETVVEEVVAEEKPPRVKRTSTPKAKATAAKKPAAKVSARKTATRKPAATAKKSTAKTTTQTTRTKKSDS